MSLPILWRREGAGQAKKVLVSIKNSRVEKEYGQMSKLEMLLQKTRADYVRVYQEDFSQARKLNLMALGVRCLNLRRRINQISKRSMNK